MTVKKTLKDIEVEVGTALKLTEQSIKDEIALKSLQIQITDPAHTVNLIVIPNKLDMKNFHEFGDAQKHNQPAWSDGCN